MTTNARSTRKPNANQERISQLEACIEKLFGHLDSDEVEILEENYSKSTTRMLEIIKLHSKSIVMMDLFEDIEFKPVVLPEEMLPLLSRHDVFLATMGFNNNQWTMLYMSAPYYGG